MLCHDKSPPWVKGVAKDSVDFQIRCLNINTSMIPSDVCVCSGIILSSYLLLLIFRICAVQILRWNFVANSFESDKNGFTLSSLGIRGFLLGYVDDACKLEISLEDDYFPKLFRKT